MLGGVETLDVRAAVALARVERRIGVVDDLVTVGARRGKGRDPDRDRERPAPAVVAGEGRGEQVVGDDLGAVGRAVRQQERELVPAGSIRPVAPAQVGAHDLGHRAKELVAGRVAAQVVDLLEVVHVDDDEGHRRPVVAGLGDPRVELLLEGAVVAEAGQRVEQRIETGAVVRLAQAVELPVDRRHAVRDAARQGHERHAERGDHARPDARGEQAGQDPGPQDDAQGDQSDGNGSDRECQPEAEIRRPGDRRRRVTVDLVFVSLVQRQAGPPGAGFRRDPPVPDPAAHNPHTKVMGPLAGPVATG